jgi:hypothetical protein
MLPSALQAELEAERSKSSSAAETIQDLQQQLGVVEQALYQKQEVSAYCQLVDVHCLLTDKV